MGNFRLHGGDLGSALCRQGCAECLFDGIHTANFRQVVKVAGELFFVVCVQLSVPLLPYGDVAGIKFGQPDLGAPAQDGSGFGGFG